MIPIEALIVPADVPPAIRQLVEETYYKMFQARYTAYADFPAVIGIPDQRLFVERESYDRQAQLQPPSIPLTKIQEKLPMGQVGIHFALKARSVIDKLAMRKAPQLQNKSGSSMLACTACMEELSMKTRVNLPCKHQYCLTCFDMLVQIGCESEQSFPPKCCSREVDKHLILRKVTSETQKKYHLLVKQIAIPADKRCYCPYEDCGKCIRLRTIRLSRGKILACSYCKRAICASCREMAQTQHLCKHELALEATIRESRRQGWKACRKCHNLIDLYTGCRHVTCKCGYQFCYVCERKWSSCHDAYACTQKLEDLRASRSDFTEHDSIDDFNFDLEHIGQLMAAADENHHAVGNIDTSENSSDHGDMSNFKDVQETVNCIAGIHATGSSTFSAAINTVTQLDPEQHKSRNDAITAMFSSLLLELRKVDEFQLDLLGKNKKNSFASINRTQDSATDQELLTQVIAERKETLDTEQELFHMTDMPLSDYRSTAEYQLKQHHVSMAKTTPEYAQSNRHYEEALGTKLLTTIRRRSRPAPLPSFRCSIQFQSQASSSVKSIGTSETDSNGNDGYSYTDDISYSNFHKHESRQDVPRYSFESDRFWPDPDHQSFGTNVYQAQTRPLSPLPGSPIAYLRGGVLDEFAANGDCELHRARAK